MGERRWGFRQGGALLFRISRFGVHEQLFPALHVFRAHKLYARCGVFRRRKRRIREEAGGQAVFQADAARARVHDDMLCASLLRADVQRETRGARAVGVVVGILREWGVLFCPPSFRGFILRLSMATATIAAYSGV